MRANGSYQRENDEYFAEPNKHDDKLEENFTKSTVAHGWIHV